MKKGIFDRIVLIFSVILAGFSLVITTVSATSVAKAAAGQKNETAEETESETDQQEATEEAVIETTAEETEEATEETAEEATEEATEESAETAEPQEVEIDGKTYMEYPLAAFKMGAGYGDDGLLETIYIYYDFEDTDLSVSEDGSELSFTLYSTENTYNEDGTREGYTSVSQTVTFNIAEPVEQLGSTGNSDFSEFAKTTDGYSVSFGKAYYDGENTLYIDVQVDTSIEHEFTIFETTVEVPLDGFSS